MLDIKFIRENINRVKKSIKDRGMDVDIEKLLKIDEKRRTQIQKVEELRSKHNKITKDVSKLSGKEKDLAIVESKKIKEKLDKVENDLFVLEKDFIQLMYKVPNVVADDVHCGKDEGDNKVLRKWGKPTKFDFKAKDHLELGEDLDIIDVKRAAKVSGTRFGYLKGAAVLLEFALVQYAFEVLTSEKILKKIASKNYSPKPFIPVVPPAMIRPDVFSKMGRLTEEDKDDKYYLAKDDLYLIGSAEHTLGSMHMDESIDKKDLPLRYIGFSTNYRRESGTYGKDTRGILRVHQFDKLEMESFVNPQDSLKEHDFFVAIQEYLMQSLKIPYQVVMICTWDIGKPNYRQIDIESWLPGQNKYRETHTADLMTDYQARRLNTKIKGGPLVHMVDATVFAIGRTLIAIMENYQQKDGSIEIPKVLQPYMGNIKKIEK